MTEQDIARFWEKVEIRTPDECWPWKASCGPNGYGQFRLNGTAARANRVACQIEHGPAPEGKPWALHGCDNPLCCNPKHLSWGNRAENMKQMSERGRSFAQSRPDEVAKGARNGCAKLTEADIPLIRKRAQEGAKHKDIAAEFGVSRPAIGYVVSGTTWRHV